MGEMYSPNAPRSRYVRPRLVDHVTIQGVPQMTDATSGLPRRYFWAVIFFAGVAFTAFHIVKQIQLYISSPITVNIDVKLTQHLRFPTITICNTNGMKRSEADHLNMTDIVKTIFPYSFQSSGEGFNSSLFQFSVVENLTLDDIGFQLGHTINDSIVWCLWEGEECNFRNFTHTFTDFGLCFTFNAGGNLEVRNSGRFYGLHLSLDAMSHEFLRSMGRTEGPGFMIAIHHYNVPPVMAEMAMSLQPGSQFYYGMEVQDVDAPDGLDGCGNRQLKHYHSDYSREACRIECFTDFTIRKCSCKDMFMPGETATCSVSAMANCYPTAKMEYLLTKGECEASCPQTCSYQTFNVKSRSNLMMADDYLTTLGNKTNKTLDYWMKNYVAIDIYMTSMSYSSITKRYSYSVLDLFCDIGGALGLALGASIMSFVELGDFCIKCCHVYLGYKNNVRASASKE